MGLGPIQTFCDWNVAALERSVIADGGELIDGV